MNIAHVALWTRSLNAQVQFWETVFGGRSNERYVSKNRPGFESHFITLDDGPTMTGDGFYEAVIADPDGNRIELVGA